MKLSNDHVNPLSMERIVPDELSLDETTGAETLRLHLERYQFAQQHLVRGSVLDIACGVGYGTVLLAEDPQVTNALGVDISASSVQYALRRYGSERVSYICSEALLFLPGRQFENIVSLETIEHVDDPNALFSHLVSLLAPQGRLIASVPVTPSVDANPHHKSNFSLKTFMRMGEEFSLKYVASLKQFQPFSPVAVGMKREARTSGLRRNLVLFYIRNPSHLLLRLWSTLRNGFANKYLTVVWEK
jgi:2-polyprenyl-3-methyl-5-hydroxy-6-metoxy-1,4-benzoquinol methylase